MPIAGVKIWTSPLMKKPTFRTTLWFNKTKYSRGDRDWFNKITERVFLGAIPLKKSSTTGAQGRLDTIPGRMKPELGVTTVVSVNEEFERCVTLTANEWSDLGVELKKIECADFNYAPPKQELLEAADFIHYRIEQGGKVYVHCKAGRTRSATVVASYLIRHEGHSVESAYDLMRKHRPHTLLHEVHIEALYELCT